MLNGFRPGARFPAIVRPSVGAEGEQMIEYVELVVVPADEADGTWKTDSLPIRGEPSSLTREPVEVPVRIEASGFPFHFSGDISGHFGKWEQFTPNAPKDTAQEGLSTLA